MPAAPFSRQQVDMYFIAWQSREYFWNRTRAAWQHSIRGDNWRKNYGRYERYEAMYLKEPSHQVTLFCWCVPQKGTDNTDRHSVAGRDDSINSLLKREHACGYPKHGLSRQESFEGFEPPTTVCNFRQGCGSCKPKIEFY